MCYKFVFPQIKSVLQIQFGFTRFQCDVRLGFERTGARRTEASHGGEGVASDEEAHHREDELFEKIDARIADMSAAADARAERSASAAAKSLDRAARDINTVRKNAGTAAQASLAAFMMQTWFMPSMLKSTAADLHDRLLWPGKAGAIFDVSEREDGSIILDDKLLPSDFYKWWWGVAGYGRRLAGDPSIVSKASAAASDFLDRFSEEEVASMIEASIDPEKSAEVIEGYRKDIKERLESTGEAS